MDEQQGQDNDTALEDMIKELRATFKEEAYELLAELESALLALERSPGDTEQIGRAFRAMHTIKGSSSACAFSDIVSFTHELETIFDKIRTGRVAVSKDIISLTLSARDQIRAMLNRYYGGGAVDDARTAMILALFKELVPEGAAAVRSAPQAPMLKEPQQACVTYRIRFSPSPEICKQGVDPMQILNELGSLGRSKVIAHTRPVSGTRDDDHGGRTTWDIVLSTSRGITAIEDIFLLVRNGSEVKIDVVDEGGAPDEEINYKKLGEILLERGDLSTEELQRVLHMQKRVGELLVATGVVPDSKIESALAEQQQVRDLREQRQGTEMTASIRVATGKLDTLVNLVGELVTVQARLSQMAASRQDEEQNQELLSIAEEVERLTESLRDNTMSIRMLPIGTTFSKFERVVRDLSSELHKEIELTTEGAETELDKTVIERLGDPLIHIIRNSIDHGIELPAVRTAAGKPAKGSIRLSAMHSGAQVLIRVRDDGAGLDAEAIRAKAVEKGLIHSQASLSEKELWDLIFAPGFSTAGTVTDVSGRGVGMDVVKKAIDGLRGTIEIESRKGLGTTITLKLPLTLAIIDGFLTRTGTERFVFPLSLVEECVELDPEDASNAQGRHLANVRGRIVPYISLRDFFAINGDRPPYEQIVIVGVDDRRIGIVVDTVVGEHQTVLKSLGRLYQNVNGISGATILGDGTVALILDIPKLVHTVEQQEMQYIGMGNTS